MKTFLLGLAILVCGLPAMADVHGTSACTWDGSSLRLSCDIYEGTAESTTLNLDSILPAGTDIAPGFLVLYEPGITGAAQLDPANWSDILRFLPRALEFYSDPLSTAITDLAQSDPTKMVLVEESGPPTVYSPGGSTYRIYSDVSEVPEPASILLFGTLLAGLAWAYRRRLQSV